MPSGSRCWSFSIEQSTNTSTNRRASLRSWSRASRYGDSAAQSATPQLRMIAFATNPRRATARAWSSFDGPRPSRRTAASPSSSRSSTRRPAAAKREAMCAASALLPARFMPVTQITNPLFCWTSIPHPPVARFAGPSPFRVTPSGSLTSIPCVSPTAKSGTKRGLRISSGNPDRCSIRGFPFGQSGGRATPRRRSGGPGRAAAAGAAGEASGGAGGEHAPNEVQAAPHDRAGDGDHEDELLRGERGERGGPRERGTARARRTGACVARRARRDGDDRAAVAVRLEHHVRDAGAPGGLRGVQRLRGGRRCDERRVRDAAYRVRLDSDEPREARERLGGGLDPRSPDGGRREEPAPRPAGDVLRGHVLRIVDPEATDPRLHEVHERRRGDAAGADRADPRRGEPLLRAFAEPWDEQLPRPAGEPRVVEGRCAARRHGSTPGAAARFSMSTRNSAAPPGSGSTTST